jgi:predicted transcriptional regulator of viral defense system
MTQFQKARDIFRTHDGMLRTSEALDHGIAPATLYNMRDQGVIVEVSRGLFRLAELPELGHPDLVIVASRVPKAVICLISALHYHMLTTQIPHYVYIALPQPIKKPRITYPPLEVVWLSHDVYEAGVEQVEMDGVMVPIYCAEKSICDSFKFRNKYGKEIAIEALKSYLQQPAEEWDLQKLLHYARIDRVESLLRPYLEVIL